MLEYPQSCQPLGCRYSWGQPGQSLMSFTVQILTGLALGILLGLFLGDLASGFSVPGEIYIAMLQMTVLPYILVSLVGNLGRVSWQKSRKLIIAAVMVLGFLLTLGIVMLLVIPLAFPQWETASFFSPTLLEAAKVFDLVGDPI